MDAQQLISWRKSLGLTQAEAADMLGTTRRSLGKYEAGEVEIPKAVEYLAIAYAAAAVEPPRDAWLYTSNSSNSMKIEAFSDHGTVIFYRASSGAIVPGVLHPNDGVPVKDALAIAWDAFRGAFRHNREEAHMKWIQARPHLFQD